jgi:hypothetical protein
MTTDLKLDTTPLAMDENTNDNNPGLLNTMDPSEEPNETSSPISGETAEQLQAIWTKVSGVLADLPEYVTDFFKSYQRPIVTIGLIFGAVISVKLTLAILGAINEIPLLSPTFEVVGLIYGGWFVYRYLLRASARQELVEDINSLKDQVLGKRS